jgi:hypothetical protein
MRPPRFRLSTLLLSALGAILLTLAGQPLRAVGSLAARAAEDPSSPAGAIPAFSHIFVVVMENKEAKRILGSDQTPYLNQLAAEYGRAARYYGVAHPSLPNYLALLAGDTLGVTENCQRCFQAAPNLADQLEARGLTWKAYFESMPAPCFTGDSRDGLYVQKHNPFIYFDGIRDDPARCGRIVPLDRWSEDLASGTVDNLVWLGPNLRSSTHDGSIAEGDRWLATSVPGVLASAAFQQDGLLVITYDEGDSTAACCGQRTGGGQIVTVLASPLGRRGFTSDTPHNHYSLLRTIEDAWGLDRLGHAGDASVASMAEFFTTPAAP